MSDRLKKAIKVSAVAIAGMYCINRLIDHISESKNLLDDKNGKYYESKQGNIFYTKQGKGSPILFIHDLNPASSAIEWDKIVKRLRRDHTVYTLDLLGCGRSDKPGITYTNYLYVQILNNFLKDVVKEPAHVVATGFSGSFTLMAKTFQKESYKKVILVNPASPSNVMVTPTFSKRLGKSLLELPVIGTTLYNYLMNRKNIHQMFTEKYFCHESLISGKLEDTYFESAHKSRSAGKYLLASLQSSYLYADLTKVIRSMDDICMISSRDKKENVMIVKEYQRLNNNIETVFLSHSKQLPQQEVPEKFCSALSMLTD